MSLLDRKHPRCLPHVVAEWTGWVCPCGHAIADHASWGDGYCTKCRCTKAYLGWRETRKPQPAVSESTTVIVNGVELIEVQP